MRNISFIFIIIIIFVSSSDSGVKVKPTLELFFDMDQMY